MRVLRSISSATALLALLATGCGSADLDPPSPVAPSTKSQSIYNGELSPTLFTAMTAAEQNAVVSVCVRHSDECFCTGALIAPRVVLTAAHCIDHPNASLGAGDLSIRFGADSDQPEATVDVVEVGFQDWRGDWADDTGVIVVEASWPAVPPITFKQGGVDSMVGNPAQLVGFGMIVGDDLNTQRYWTTLEVQSVDAAGISVEGQGVTGIAPGDSGGPILFDFGAGVQVAGVASISEPGWIYGALYAPVSQHESWIQGYVDSAANPDCSGACAGMVCGVDQGCLCGNCPYGETCNGGQCQAIQPGSGGICVGLDATSHACQGGSGCAGGEECYQYPDGSASECGATCGHQPCAAGDSSSYCFPIATQGGGYVPLCFSASATTCPTEGDFCSTSGGDNGLCLDPEQSGNRVCLAFCQPVSSCPEGQACAPAALTCAEHCAGKECGSYYGCICGNCAGDESCVDGTCQACQPQCDGRECGNDGCGGTCGDCAPGEYCVQSQCQDVSGNDAGSGLPDTAGSGPDVGVAPPGADAGGDDGAGAESGCSCGQSAPRPTSWLPLFLLVACRWRRSPPP